MEKFEGLDDDEYNRHIEALREDEFPMLNDVVYLDHAGTAIPPKSLMDRFAKDMVSHLYGNPHSTSVAAQNTSKKIESIRLRLLDFFNADPDEYDLVFVANATAGIKLIADAFRDQGSSDFWYGYHRESHTSLVGARELASVSRCFESDDAVVDWIRSPTNKHELGLFAYPGQSNMNGRRLPLDWCTKTRAVKGVYTLLDAASLASTSALDLSSSSTAPDFVVLSLYKIFGFPDLGALIVRKEAGSIFAQRRYFGGGTVDMVTCADSWHAKRSGSLHEQLEDGSLPIHSILALASALDVHEKLFGTLDRISRHCDFLARRLHDGLASMRHANGSSVCKMYHSYPFHPSTQGPVIALNFQDHAGNWIGTSEVEKLSSVRNIQLRTGGLCNPGGVAAALDLSPEDMKRNFASGQRCGNEHDILHGVPTGMVRLSLGPENSLRDVQSFLDFVDEFFVSKACGSPEVMAMDSLETAVSRWHVERMMIYPIKSCAGWDIPSDREWKVNSEGLVWDREWCIIIAGSGVVMSQKRYPRMALIRPTLNLEEGLLHISFADPNAGILPITIPLYLEPSSAMMQENRGTARAIVCGDNIQAQPYTNPDVTDFFTRAIGVPCHLARFPAGGLCSMSLRHSKPHLQNFRRRKPDFNSSTSALLNQPKQPLLLSNESPILVISRSSLNRLNEHIKVAGNRAVHASAFRANIVVAEDRTSTGMEQPYDEDNWSSVRVGSHTLDVLGPCRRCQMVCIDQVTATRSSEPFSTLAKTRKYDGKTWFGVHAALHEIGKGNSTLRVGDLVLAAYH